MRNFLAKLALAGLVSAASTGALAGVYTQSPDPASVAPGAQVNIDILFAGDGATQDTQLDLDYNATVFPTVTGVALVAGSICAVNPSPTFIRIVPPSGAGTALTSTATAYCRFQFTAAAGAAAGNYDFVQRFIECDAGACTRSGTFRITVTGGGGGNTAPSLGYAPTTGTTINYPAGGAGPSITVSNAGGGSGSGAAATTTLTNCTISGGGAAFPTTNFNPNITAVAAGAPAPTSFTLPNCTPQAAAQNATLTCVETRGGTAASPAPTWPLTCPAAAVANTPPTITYTPAAGSNINVAAGGNTTIAVGCPTDGSACNGSGTGLAATSRLENLTVAYAGPPFSPLPSNLSCAFVTEAGGAAASPLDFVATAADAGDIRCTCANVVVAEPYTVSVSERIPANSGAVTATRTFNVTCGNGLTCGSIAANPASGTVSLNNGGAAVTATTISVTGISPGINQTVTCSVSGASAGSTFAVTTVPSPLVLNSVTTSGTVSATCTNSNTTTATATLTCTSVGSAAGCPALSSTYTLSCPGQNAPPPVSTVPVPALSEQGRILLAALVLLLGVGVVGFRLRG